MSELISRYAAQLKKRIAADVVLPEPTNQQNAATLASTLRQHGLPVQVYRLSDPAAVGEIAFPFLAPTDSGWAMVTTEKIVTENGRSLPDPLPADPVIVGEPPVGLMFKPLESVPPDPRGEAVIFYTATNAPRELAEAQLVPDLRSLIEWGRKSKKRVIFLDSLGLIPAEQIDALGGDRSAFEAAIANLKREIDSIASGNDRARDPRNPVWNVAYEVLREGHVESILEDLNFELWRKAIDFDEQKLPQTAISHFVGGQLEQAAKLMAEYQLEFHRINCNIRNENLVSQVSGLDDGQGLLLLMVREIGHFGVLERIFPNSGFAVRAKLLGEGRFPSLLARFGMESILDNIGVPLTPAERKLIALRSCLKALVLQALAKDKPLFEFTRKLPDLHQIDRLSWETIEGLIDELHSPIRVYLRNDPYGQSVRDQLLYLLKEKNIILSSLVNDPADSIGGDG